VPYRKHLSSDADLVTTYEATRAGFILQALERSKRATPHVEEARSLRVAAAAAKDPAALLSIQALYGALLTAAGVSDKAAKQMNDNDKDEAIEGFIAGYLEPAGGEFVEELVYRFLLTRGDALGGTMRNVAGVWGRQRVLRSLVAALGIQSKRYEWRHGASHKWIRGSKDDPKIEESADALAWKTGTKPRLLVFNKKPSFIGMNVDVCILQCVRSQFDARKNDPVGYLALGELKGGVDPAGADEHWKTARTTLQRVRTEFSKHEQSPDTFFIGAAIAPKMAEEIWGQLQGKVLANAANLTVPSQITSLCQWLANL